MKKLLTILAIFAIGLAITACGNNNTPSSSVVVEEPKDYTAILLAARNEKDNEVNDILGKNEDGKVIFSHNPRNIEVEPNYKMTFDVLGLAEEDMEDFAISTSLINIKAYSTVIIKPAEGKGEAIKESLTKYVEAQQKNFEQYLRDQYDIALNAKLEIVDSGEVVLVLCKDAEEVFEAIKKGLE